MKRSLTTTTAAWMAITIATSTGGVEAFAVPPPQTASCRSTSSSSHLYLVPEQGKQLEAAMNAAYARAEQQNHYLNGDDATTTTAEATATTTLERPPLSQSARSFVARVFALPSHIIRGHPHPNLEGLPVTTVEASTSDIAESSFGDWENSADNNNHDDVVLFPLVGFQCVQDGPNHYRALPSKTNASCRLKAPGSQEEVVVGWFSKACHLDFYGDHYCDEPTTTTTTNTELN